MAERFAQRKCCIVNPFSVSTELRPERSGAATYQSGQDRRCVGAHLRGPRFNLASAVAIRAIGRAGLLAAICSTTATILYINAFRHSSVADVAVILAVAPFLTAGIGWLWLGTKEPWTTLAASFVALVGVIIMVGGAVADGHLFGDLLALGMTLCMAIMMLIIRQHHETPMLPAACLSALLCPLLVWQFAAPLDVSTIAICSNCSCSAQRSSAWASYS